MTHPTKPKPVTTTNELMAVVTALLYRGISQRMDASHGEAPAEEESHLHDRIHTHQRVRKEKQP